MTVYRVKPRRKSGENVLDNLIFLTDASAVDLTGFTRFTDQELTGVIPDVSENMNASEAFKTLEEHVLKKYPSKKIIIHCQWTDNRRKNIY